MTEDYRGHARSLCSRNPPSADDKNLKRRLSGPPTGTQIPQNLDKKVQVDSSVSQELDIVPDPEDSASAP